MDFAQIAFEKQRKKKVVFVFLKALTLAFIALFAKRFTFLDQLVRSVWRSKIDFLKLNRES
jgi:hypothetical protein